MPRSRMSRRNMRGGLFEFLTGPQATPDASGTSMTDTAKKAVENTLANIKSTADEAKKLSDKAMVQANNAISQVDDFLKKDISFTASPQSTTTPSSQPTTAAGRRRYRMRAGNGVMPSMSKFSSNAMEVNNIQMAQPNTLVGGRRRRRSSQRRSRRRRTSRRSRSRRSRRN